jgi:hypothetical protein
MLQLHASGFCRSWPIGHSVEHFTLKLICIKAGVHNGTVQNYLNEK